MNLVFTYDSTFIFGGYVRDMIVGHERNFNDIDIYFKYMNDAKHFVQVLKIMMNVKEEHVNLRYGNDTVHYAKLYIKCGTKQIPIDIVCENLNTDMKIDFSCNNLKLTSTGIGLCTIVDGQSEHETLLMCMNDIAAKKLRFIGSTVYKKKMFERLKRMQHKGWFVHEDSVLKIVPEPRQSIENEHCSICHDTFKGRPCVQTTCKHVFHLSCFQKFVTITRNKHQIKCPMCRNDDFIVKKLLV
jgi:hypothetical protein